jgi:hypothetical protein
MNDGLRRWLLLVAVMTGVGIAKVAQQTALSLAAYRVGRSYRAHHELENQTAWLRMEVLSMQSPIALARTMHDRHVTLVAWSNLPDAIGPSTVSVAAAPDPKTTRVAIGASVASAQSSAGNASAAAVAGEQLALAGAKE